MNRFAVRYTIFFTAAPLLVAMPQAVTGAGTGASITPEELMAMLQRGEKVTIIDVRTPEEYRAGHIPESVSIPLDEIEDTESIPDVGRIILYCTAGVRGGRAQKILYKKGVKGALNLRGGIKAWVEAGGEIVPEEEYLSGYPGTFTVPKGVCEQNPPSMRFGGE